MRSFPRVVPRGPESRESAGYDEPDVISRRGHRPRLGSIFRSLEAIKFIRHDFGEAAQNWEGVKFRPYNIRPYTLTFVDPEVQAKYDAERDQSLSSGLVLFLLIGCGGLWAIYCPRIGSDSDAWSLAANITFYVLYILPLALFLALRSYYLTYGLPERLKTMKKVLKHVVPIGASLTCGILLLNRCFDSAYCDPTSLSFVDSHLCNPFAQLQLLPADSALVNVIIPPFLQIVLNLDRNTSIYSLLICWSCLIASAVKLGNTNVNVWFLVFAGAIPLKMYEVERQSVVNFRLSEIEKQLIGEATALRSEAVEAVKEAERKKEERDVAVIVSDELRSFISHMAHDFKSPFTAIVLAVETLKAQLTAKPEVHSAASADSDADADGSDTIGIVNNIASTLQYLEMSINRSVDYAKLTGKVPLVPNCTRVNVSDYVSAVVETVSWQSNDTTVYLAPLSADVPTAISTDASWFRDNLLCAVANAAKFSPTNAPQPAVTVQVEAVANFVKPNMSSRSTRGALAPGGGCGGGGGGNGQPMIVFHVLDSGPRLPESQQAEFFYTPIQIRRNGEGGLGVGMYTLAARVRALGGYYGFRRRLDGRDGNEVWFAMPLRTDSMKDCSPQIRSQSNTPPQTPPLPPLSKQRQSRKDTLGSSVKREQVSEEGFGPAAYRMNTVLTTDDLEYPEVGLYTALSGKSMSQRFCESAKHEKESKYSEQMSGMTALVVDDAISINKMVTFVLKRAGVVVTQAKNGQEALTHMTRQKFDFVIMDIQMPVMDGLEATRLIREHEARNCVPVKNKQTIIGMSANSESHTSSAATEAGMNCFLPKPFTLDTVAFYLMDAKRCQ